MKNLSIVLSIQIIASFLFFGIHVAVLNHLNTLNFERLAHIYVINFLLVALTIIITYFIHKKSPEFVGFSYLFLALFKIAIVVAILYTQTEYRSYILSFMTSYIISLFLEIYLMTTKIFREEKVSIQN